MVGARRPAVLIAVMGMFLLGFVQGTADRAAAATLSTASAVAVGYSHACLIATSGSAGYCWGRNDQGQLGDGTGTNSSVPVAVAGGHAWSAIDGGYNHTCAIDGGGAAYCWGHNSYGELGDGTTNTSLTPVLVTGGYTWAMVSAGDSTTCGVTNAGAAYCWGTGAQGKRGDGTTGNVSSPTLVSGGLTWSTVSVGTSHTCGVTTGGAAYCWGRDLEGELGNAAMNAGSNVPVAVVGNLTWSKISAAENISCGVTTSGTGYCWGGDAYGSAGTGGAGTVSSPTPLAGGRQWSMMIGGSGASCGIATTGLAYCAGADGLGALGDGGSASQSTPVAVSGGQTWASLAVGGGGACGLTSSNLVYCWGWDAYGNLGDGGTTNRNVPTGVVSFSAPQSSATISAILDPILTFTVSGRASACNGEPNLLGGAGGASSVSFGRIAASSSASGAQDLSVVTNAASGFTVYLRGAQASQPLRSTNHNWTDVSASYGSPAPLGAGEQFGYTYADATASSSVTNPGSANFVKLDGTNRAVMGSTASQSGSGCVAFTAQTGTATPAGTYTAVVVYSAVPTY